MSMPSAPAPRYYRLMGQAPFAGTTIATILSWLAIVLLAALYAYADLYIKFVDKLSVLILMAFAAAMGFAVAGVVRLGKVRNLVVIFVIALSSALLALYASWVVWEIAILRRDEMYLSPWFLFRRPDIVWEIAVGLNETGTYSMRDRAVTGTELWVTWGIEAATIVGCTLLIPVFTLRRLAFCEECGTWCQKRANLARFAPADDHAVRRQVESRQFDALGNSGAPADDAAVFNTVELFRCPRCAQTNLLTVNRVNVGIKDGQRVEKATPIVDRLWLQPHEAEQILALRERMRALEAADAPSLPDGSQPAPPAV